MSEFALRVESISKEYQLGRLDPYRTLKEIAKRPLREIRGLLTGQNVIHNSLADHSIWALKDVSFNVKHGEVVGIIGRNGAGKSTLLKILSRITSPTHGRVRLYGKVASLLEVGTGFHPELTGRENLFLNASIIGMSRKDIERRFDEIVSFAEVEQFIDTPVKHYSSGMYMRLAFSVSAHLTQEILILDEVLAVGDAAFQQKCLGKMQNEAMRGRTVLFVSHDLGAVASLCTRAILIDKGKVVQDGNVKDVVSEYQSQTAVQYQPLDFSVERIEVSTRDNVGVPVAAGMENESVFFKSKADDPGIPVEIREPLARGERFGNGKARIKSYRVTPYTPAGEPSSIMRVGYDLEIEMEFVAFERIVQASAAVGIFDLFGLHVIDVNTAKKHEYIDLEPGETGSVKFRLRKVLLRPAPYRILLWIGRYGVYNIDGLPMAMSLNVEMNPDLFAYSIEFRGAYLIEFDYRIGLSLTGDRKDLAVEGSI